ncbi:MAG: CRISPR-associated helicase Cas3' [Clostridia bacterium]|nr:CRISPR-associated helicase Cas3' [Clostridia bacterium]
MSFSTFESESAPLIELPEREAMNPNQTQAVIRLFLDAVEMLMPENEKLLLARICDGRKQTLRMHCEGVAALCATAGASLGLPTLYRLCGLLHDMGKASEAFQAYLERGNPAERGSVAHAAYGALYARTRWSGRQQPTADLLAAAIAVHHGRLPDLLNQKGDVYWDMSLAPEHFPDADAVAARYAAQVVSEAELDLLFTAACSEVRVWYARLRAACVDLPADSRRAGMANMLSLAARGLYGALIDADRFDAYRFETGAEASPQPDAPWDAWLQRLGAQMASLPHESEIDRCRSKIAEDCAAQAGLGAGVYRLNVPTGGGKTFASLRFALEAARAGHMARILYVAPYKTILEQTADVFRRTLADDALILEHHGDAFPDEQEDDSGREALRRWQMLTDRWQAPLILTTAVQWLDTLFAGRSAAARRFPAMERCVIILDEVQCIPVRCWYLVTLAIRYLTRVAGCAVVLCTATQPMWEALAAYPLMPPVPLVQEEGKLYDVFRRVRALDLRTEGELSPEAIAARVVAALPEAGSALCILNTKRTVRALYEAFTALKLNVPVYCLTTLQCPAHRLRLLAEIRALLKAGQPILCVATQLIEAGVDVSFGLTVRALAGMESIAQAAGRCNRNRERSSYGEILIARFTEMDVAAGTFITPGCYSGLIVTAYPPERK